MNPDIDRQICFLRGFPTNKWDVGKQRDIYEMAYKEARTRLETFRRELLETEAKFLARGVPEDDLERWRAEQTNQHIKLLEAVIGAKRNVEWSKKTLREVVDEKIRILSAQVESEDL